MAVVIDVNIEGTMSHISIQASVLCNLENYVSDVSDLGIKCSLKTRLTVHHLNNVSAMV